MRNICIANEKTFHTIKHRVDIFLVYYIECDFIIRSEQLHGQ